MPALESAPADTPRSVLFILSALSGYVDSCTFLGLFGLFVAQVTGSFVFAGAQLIAKDPHITLKVMAIPMFFIAGIITTVLASWANRRGHSPWLWTLVFQWLLLLGFLVVGVIGEPFASASAPLAAMAAFFGISAMGVQSVMGRVLIQPPISTNVMTTNISQLAVDVTEVMFARYAPRRRDDGWQPLERLSVAKKNIAMLGPVLVGFLLGTLIGAIAYAVLGFSCVIIVILISSGLIGWAYTDWRRQSGAFSG